MCVYPLIEGFAAVDIKPFFGSYANALAETINVGTTSNRYSGERAGKPELQ